MFFFKKKHSLFWGGLQACRAVSFSAFLLKIHVSHSTSSAFEGNTDGRGAPQYRLIGGMIDWSNQPN